MRRFFKNKIAVTISVLTLILIVLAVILNSAAPNAPFVQNSVGVIITPVQHLFSGAQNGIRSFFSRFGDAAALSEENQSLNSEIASLRNEIRELQSVKDENTGLRKMLGLKEANPELELEAANLIATDPTNWYSTFTIDKGSKDGISINQAVINSDKYLVGRIYEVGTTWARVITLSDPEHSAGCVISRSRDPGVAECDSELASQRKCRISYLAQDADVIVGDYVETSGIGGIYPAGLQLGKIVEIHEETPSMSKYAIMEISADIDHLTQVFVVKNNPNALPDE